MNPNIKPSDQVAVMATVDPVSQGVGTILTDYVDMSQVDSILAILKTGVLGAAATVDAKLRQATSNAGANVKDIANKAITQVVKASGDNKQVLLNCRSDELDIANGFQFVALSITVGAAASLIDATILGFYGRYQPVSDLASVAETIG